ncbi:MAG: DUF1573 domain-containing protein [Bacteroidota bacterium]
MRLLVLTLLLASTAAGQPRFAFEAATHDFGRIAEVGGFAETIFRFENAGDAPLRITRVDATCGCTTPSWSTGDIEPGGSGFVTVAYDPDGRPGPFDKTVRVSAGDAEPVVLRVEGVVESALAQTGVRLGSFAFNRTVADAGTAPAGGDLQTSFQFANVSERPIRIASVEAPDYVEIAWSERPIFPDRLAGFYVSIRDASRHATEGEIDVEFTVHTDDPDQPVKRLAVRGRVE